jgi:gliding motility-associated-like protein
MEITIYDAFSPNADGKNDVWNIRNIQAYPNCVVKIFNSWGIAVFDSKGYDEPWDGKHNGNELPAGTYYYYIDLGDGNETFTGTVNIVK